MREADAETAIRREARERRPGVGDGGEMLRGRARREVAIGGERFHGRARLTADQLQRACRIVAALAVEHGAGAGTVEHSTGMRAEARREAVRRDARSA